MKKHCGPELSLGLLFLVLLFSAGCKSANPFVGTWKPTADSDPGMKIESLTIKDDGTFSMHAKDSTGPDLTGKWKAEGKKVTLEPEHAPRPLEMVLGDDGRLTVSESGKTAHFAKS